jgi:hypothetical protein
MRRAVAVLTVLLLVLPSPVGLFTQVALAQNYSYPVNPNAQSNPYGGQQQAGSAQPYAGQSYAGQGRYSGQYSGQYSSQVTNQAYGESQQTGQQVGQAFTPELLEKMVAPIALYPDTLIAQILAAATYPAQVSAADQWLRAQSSAPAGQIAAGANAQTAWDPSIKALTAFPQVLAMMDRNLNWTTDLGNAYYNQTHDVLATIQAMRQRAHNAGTLQSTPREVVTDNQGYIQLAPANPRVVYVPAYNPWYVYGQPVSPYPGFSLLGAIESFMGSAPIRFGLGIGMNSFLGTSFGWLGWALDWLGSAILFHHSNYYSQSTSVAKWNSPSGGSYNYGQPEGYGTRQTAGSYRSQEGFSQSASGAVASGFDRYGHRQGENYAGNGPYENHLTEPSARARAGNSGRPAAPYAMERGQQAQAIRPTRPQYYSRPDNYGSSQQARAARPATPYAGPRQSWSAPAYSQPRGDSSGPSYHENRRKSASAGRVSAQKAPKPESSGGSHLFGGGHGGSSYHAPKPPKAPKSFRGGKHSGGGFSGGHHSDKHHR